MERPLILDDAWEQWGEVTRQGHDLADKFTQQFNGLITSHINYINPSSLNLMSWEKPSLLKNVEFPSKLDFGLGRNEVSAIFDIGSRLSQAGQEFGNSFNGVVKEVFRRVPNEVFRGGVGVVRAGLVSAEGGLDGRRGDVPVVERCRSSGYEEMEGMVGGSGALGGVRDGNEEGGLGIDLRTIGQFGRPQATVNITSTYDSRSHDVESSLVARGDLWRVEASHGSSTSRIENSPPLLVQLGPLLFVRDSTFLVPVHLSKQHLLWYGYDRKKGMHSICPAVWSKQRRWLVMSMICLNPLACSFMDLQFPNGQFTYVSGEGLTSSVFAPVLGGLLQAQGQFPGEMRFSFSCKNCWGTSVTPSVQWPDKSFSVGLVQPLAWQRSGIMIKPTVQVSLCPTFGGSDPGLRAELIQSINKRLKIIYSYTCTARPSASASISLGRSKWNGNVGSSGVVVRAETSIGSVGRPSISVQLNSGFDF